MITDRGNLNVTGAANVAFSTAAFNPTQIVVASGGTLTASNTQFTGGDSGTNGNFIAGIHVQSGGHLVASATNFGTTSSSPSSNALDFVSLDVGSVFNPGDLDNNTFNTTLSVPPQDIALLTPTDPTKANLQFQRIYIDPVTLTSGQTVPLNLIGSQSTSQLVYVFPTQPAFFPNDYASSTLTIAPGTSLSVTQGVNVQIQGGGNIVDRGNLNVTGAADVAFSTAAFNPTQIVVASGGTLTASNTQFTGGDSGTNGNFIAGIHVQSGGHLVGLGDQLRHHLLLAVLQRTRLRLPRFRFRRHSP